MIGTWKRETENHYLLEYVNSKLKNKFPSGCQLCAVFCAQRAGRIGGINSVEITR